MDGLSHPRAGPSPEEPGIEEVGKPKDKLEQREERVGLTRYYSDELLDAKKKVEMMLLNCGVGEDLRVP